MFKKRKNKTKQDILTVEDKQKENEPPNPSSAADENDRDNVDGFDSEGFVDLTPSEQQPKLLGPKQSCQVIYLLIIYITVWNIEVQAFVRNFNPKTSRFMYANIEYFFTSVCLAVHVETRWETGPAFVDKLMYYKVSLGKPIYDALLDVALICFPLEICIHCLIKAGFLKAYVS